MRGFDEMYEKWGKEWHRLQYEAHGLGLHDGEFYKYVMPRMSDETVSYVITDSSESPKRWYAEYVKWVRIEAERRAEKTLLGVGDE